MSRIYNRRSLKKHGVSEDEILQVLRSSATVTIDLPPSNRGHDRVMWVGFTFNLRLLEIGIEYLPEDRENVFHADDATKRYEQAFLNERKQ